jgi:hypothetical protein
VPDIARAQLIVEVVAATRIMRKGMRLHALLLQKR